MHQVTVTPAYNTVFILGFHLWGRGIEFCGGKEIQGATISLLILQIGTNSVCLISKR